MRRGRIIAPGFALPAAGLTGFYANGATNTKLKAAMNGVIAGTRRATGVILGDSLQVGIGAGTTSDPGRITNAAPNRPAAVLASLYTSAGIRMLDQGFVNDGGLQANGITLSTYDPRVDLGSPAWTGPLDRTFAGGGHLDNAATISGLKLTPTVQTDTVDIVLYNAGTSHVITSIDASTASSAYATGSATQITTPSAVGGFSKLTIKAASAGNHVYAIASDSPAAAAKLCRMTAYNSTLPAVDLIVQAAGSSSTADLAAVGNGFRNLDHIQYVAPDFTIVEALTNDMNAGRSISAAMSDLQAIINAAKSSGDVLLVFPTPTSLVSDTIQQNFNTAAKQLAANSGVAFLSLLEYYGPYNSTFGARTVDGTHPLAPLDAEIAGLFKQALDLMRAT